MQWHLAEIDGNEPKSGDGGPRDALIEFYRSFNEKDLSGLEGVWLAGQDPSMDNPIGGIRRGWSSIAEGYTKLFNGRAEVNVTFHDFTSQGGEGWHLFVGRERGECRTPEESMDLAIRTTRWFIRYLSFCRSVRIDDCGNEGVGRLLRYIVPDVAGHQAMLGVRE